MGKRATSRDEILPLIDLCKNGRLFDVQIWISAGKPVDAPEPPPKGNWPKTPLQYAIDAGFHSMVQVLLEAGVDIEPERRYNPLIHAVKKKRLDIARLLIKHGSDAKSIVMSDVFETWDPEMMNFFADKGADLNTNRPLAYALCEGIRTALNFFKRYKDKITGLQEQADIALRFHTMRGNAKWVSLMLWAGANPYSKGPYEWHDKGNWGFSAQEYALMCHKRKMLSVRGMELKPDSPNINSIIRHAIYSTNFHLMSELLELGYTLNNKNNGGSYALERAILQLGSYSGRKRHDNDSDYNRNTMKMVHFLTKHGAKWCPRSQKDIENICDALRNVITDYALELIWLSYRYDFTSQDTMMHLLAVPSMVKHMKHCQKEIDRIRNNFHMFKDDQHQVLLNSQ